MSRPLRPPPLDRKRARRLEGGGRPSPDAQAARPPRAGLCAKTLFWIMDGGWSRRGRQPETRHEAHSYLSDPARRLPVDRYYRCPPERRRNLSPLVRAVLRPQRRQELRFVLVQTMHHDGWP